MSSGYYPVMSRLEEENAPWNQDDPDTEIKTVLVSMTFSREFELELVPDYDYSDQELIEMINKKYKMGIGEDYNGWTNDETDVEIE